MQVILLDKVVNLGGLGDIVKVKDGYARNFLIPTGAARRATASAKAEFEAKRVELEKQAAEKLAAAQQLGEKLNGVNVKLTQKAGVDGRLFGSVTNADIAEELTKAGFAVAKSQVRLVNGPIKTVGDATVVVALHTDVSVE
ncbi:MAG: 50S ribosomal protein L9, partial [Delftia acidovorans]|nr:50S ribosomal protein L9 [Delftia acidovorans]